MSAASPKRGLFLVLEGIEGSGKSTQRDLLAAWLSAQGVPFRVTREPGGTRLGEEVRRLILESDHMDDRAELLLLLAARATVVADEIRPALAAGEVVVADRHALSSLAYQGQGRGLGVEEVRALNRFATGGLEPDLTIVLDVPPAIGVARLQARGRPVDRIEAAGADFHAWVAEAYRLLASSEPNTKRVDATGSPEAVHDRIVALLCAEFPETLAPAKG